jgi:DNA polymerase III delta prime subunit
MAAEVFHLTTVTQWLDEGGCVVEALGLPEVSVLAESERRALAGLRQKAKAVLEDAELSPAALLFRRRAVMDAELDEVELHLEPPRRGPGWQEPVSLRLCFVRWSEGDLHLALVPALGALVYATQSTALSQRVAAHARLLLAGQSRSLGLAELARAERSQRLALGQLEVTIERKTPRQLAEAADETDPELSQLAKLAEALPPPLAGKPASPAVVLPCFAFEAGAELAALAEALVGEVRRSVLLVGPPGCGKTALVHELARRQREFSLADTPFWSTTGARLMSGPVGFGMWQERCQRLCREAASTRAVVHLHALADLLEVGKTERAGQSVGGFLRPWIARGELVAIAEATPEQLTVIARLEPQLLAAFRQLIVAEPSAARTRAVLAGVWRQAEGDAPTAAALAESELALHRLHQLHQRYATYSANPGRPVRFLKNLLADSAPSKALTEAAVVQAFSRETGLPLVLLDDAVPLDLDATREWFTRRVLGQPEAVARVLDLLALSKARLARPGKPLASLLLIGPTGTGKTEMAKALAAFLFGDEARLTRFDLNEFTDALAVQRLMGGASGAEGLLTARVREQPFSVLLLDEFEKADASFFDLLLQILGDARLTDAAGRVADFSNCAIVMTSNLGAQGFQRGPAGFQTAAAKDREARAHFIATVRDFLRPEIFNRLDAIVPFDPLAPETMLAIARRQLELVTRRDGLALRPIELNIAPGVAEHLARVGYDARYGARPLKRAVDRELTVPLAEALSRHVHGDGQRWRVTVEVGDGGLRIEVSGTHAPDVEFGSPGKAADSELAGALVKQRRVAAKFGRGVAVQELQDQLTLLTALEKRQQRAERKPAAPDPRLAQLPKLRACLAGVRGLVERVEALEARALGAFYLRQSPGPSPADTERPVSGADETSALLIRAEMRALADELPRWRREVFRLRRPASDDVLLALFSEHRETLLMLAAGCVRLAQAEGTLLSLEALLPPKAGRRGAVVLAREPVAKPADFFRAPPEKLLGLALHVRGELFQPRFAGEAGLHEFVHGQTTNTCLWLTAQPPLDKYIPPAGIERPGGIAALGEKLRRRYDLKRHRISDARLGESTWAGDDLSEPLGRLSTWDLEQRIAAETD